MGKLEPSKIYRIVIAWFEIKCCDGPVTFLGKDEQKWVEKLAFFFWGLRKPVHMFDACMIQSFTV